MAQKEDGLFNSAHFQNEAVLENMLQEQPQLAKMDKRKVRLKFTALLLLTLRNHVQNPLLRHLILRPQLLSKQTHPQFLNHITNLRHFIRNRFGFWQFSEELLVGLLHLFHAQHGCTIAIDILSQFIHAFIDGLQITE